MRFVPCGVVRRNPLSVRETIRSKPPSGQTTGPVESEPCRKCCSFSPRVVCSCDEYLCASNNDVLKRCLRSRELTRLRRFWFPRSQCTVCCCNACGTMVFYVTAGIGRRARPCVYVITIIHLTITRQHRRGNLLSSVTMRKHCILIAERLFRSRGCRKKRRRRTTRT